MPDELAGQIPLVHRACEALGVPILTHERYEADDVIGTMTERAAAEGYDVAIVTGDKDFFQLVRDGIRVYNPRDEGTWYDAAGVKEKFGVAPDQVVDVLALMGDTIDNVKGVPGIGEKGARDLIATYGTLDALLERAADVPQKKYREALLAHADEARSSRELLRIHTDVPVEFDITRVPLPRAVARGLLRAVLRARLPLARHGVRADRRHDRARTTALVDDAGGASRRSPRSCARRAASRCASCPTAPAAVRAGIVGLAFSTVARHGAVRAARSRRRALAATQRPARPAAGRACSTRRLAPTRLPELAMLPAAAGGPRRAASRCSRTRRSRRSATI